MNLNLRKAVNFKQCKQPSGGLPSSVRKRPVLPGLKSKAAGLGFLGGRPGRTVGFGPALAAYLARPGRTADICRFSSDRM